MTPSIRVSTFALLAMVACSGSEEPGATTAEDLTVSSANLLGDFAFGGSAVVELSSSPRYRALRVAARAGDTLDVQVAGLDASHPVAFILDARMKTLAQDGGPTSPTAHVLAAVVADGDYYVVVSEAQRKRGRMRVALAARPGDAVLGPAPGAPACAPETSGLLLNHDRFFIGTFDVSARAFTSRRFDCKWTFGDDQVHAAASSGLLWQHSLEGRMYEREHWVASRLADSSNCTVSPTSTISSASLPQSLAVVGAPGRPDVVVGRRDRELSVWTASQPSPRGALAASDTSLLVGTGEGKLLEIVGDAVFAFDLASEWESSPSPARRWTRSYVGTLPHGRSFRAYAKKRFYSFESVPAGSPTRTEITSYSLETGQLTPEGSVDFVVDRVASSPCASY